MATPDELISAIESLPGVKDVRLGIHDLTEVGEDSLSLAILEYPLGALRRTNGGQDGETLVSISFQTEATQSGHRSLELIAHVVTDASRGGSAMQLRAAARPISVPSGVQTGTLTFYVDWWATSETDIGADAQHLIDALELEFEQVLAHSPDHFR